MIEPKTGLGKIYSQIQRHTIMLETRISALEEKVASQERLIKSYDLGNCNWIIKEGTHVPCCTSCFKSLEFKEIEIGVCNACKT